MMWKFGVAMLVPTLVAGCQSVAPPPMVQVAAPVMPLASAKPVGLPPVQGVLAGPLGEGLSHHDRRAAFNSLLLALTSGKRQSWRGAGTAFGYATPQPSTGVTALTEFSCSPYDLHVFVDGRGRSGRGKACKGADGTWTFTSS